MVATLLSTRWHWSSHPAMTLERFTETIKVTTNRKEIDNSYFLWRASQPAVRGASPWEIRTSSWLVGNALTLIGTSSKIYFNWDQIENLSPIDLGRDLNKYVVAGNGVTLYYTDTQNERTPGVDDRSHPLHHHHIEAKCPDDDKHDDDYLIIMMLMIAGWWHMCQQRALDGAPSQEAPTLPQENSSWGRFHFHLCSPFHEDGHAKIIWCSYARPRKAWLRSLWW